MVKKYLAAVIFFLLTTGTISAQKTDYLRNQVEQLLASKNTKVGVSVLGLETKDTLSINSSSHFPLQSVFKFPIALFILRQVDLGKFSLSQKILIREKDLLPNTWSPMRDKYPAGNVKISLSEILRYMVSESDNNACDILLRLGGGAGKVNDFVHRLGIKDMAIRYNEEEMHRAWDIQFSNWSTPLSSTQSLQLFYERKILSQRSHDFLWKIMSETSTGKDRIKGQLPAGTLVAHKTGTSDTNEEGVTAAINDIGIVTLPNGNHFAITVFVSDSKENTQENEKIISVISKLTWDYFMSKNGKN